MALGHGKVAHRQITHQSCSWGFGVDFSECPCRNTKDVLGHAVVWSVQDEISEMGRIVMKSAMV
jgi:hypothetical protein